MHAIETQGLRMVYRGELFKKSRAALEGLDLAVEEGEIFGYIGPNGAGKTTTIKCLVGLVNGEVGCRHPEAAFPRLQPRSKEGDDRLEEVLAALIEVGDMASRRHGGKVTQAQLPAVLLLHLQPRPSL